MRQLFRRPSRGQTMVVFVFAAATVIGAFALSADVLGYYWNWEQIQKAADAGALAGASQYIQHIPSPTVSSSGCAGAGSSTAQVACGYTTTNQTSSSEVTVEVPSSVIPASVPAGAKTVRVNVRRSTISSYFARLFGRTTPYSAGASAIAVGPTVTGGVHNGLFPAGFAPLPNGQKMTYGQTYTLTANYSSGNWGWLDIPTGTVGSTTPGSATPGGGAAQLSTNITNGCTCDEAINDWIMPETGVKYGQVSSAVSQIANGSTAPSVLTGNEPQLVTAPIVDWSTSNGGSSAVKILGFAEVWVIGMTKSGNTETLQVQFVQYVSKYASGTAAGSGNDYGSSKRPYLVQ